LSGTLEEIHQSASLDAERPRLPRIHDPHTGVRRVAYECERLVAWAKTQSWLPTAVVFLGVVLLIAVPSVSLLRASDGDRHASAGTNATEINGTDARRAMLAVRRGEVLGDAEERIHEGHEWTERFT
jgi:hypothetical protein